MFAKILIFISVLEVSPDFSYSVEFLGEAFSPETDDH